jgi:zinc/manganese transport system substrate-binding protein
VLGVRTGVVAVLALACLALAACSAPGGAAARPVTTAGDPARCPGPVVDVVVSVSQWTDLARTLGGDCARVTTVLASAAVDPHDFEPRPADIAAFDDADLVVLNGAGYDTWASDALTNVDPAPAVVSAAGVAGLRAGSAANPHLWYEPDLLPRIAAAITRQLGRIAPADSAVFTAAAATWTADLAPYSDAVTSLRAAAAGRSYAATEPVFDLMAGALGLTDATPAGYRSAAGNDSDPSPGDIAAFQSALEHHQVDVLVVNTQTEGTLPAQLRTVARRAGVPVVEVTESPPDAGGSFVAWQLAQLQQLSTALGPTP